MIYNLTLYLSLSLNPTIRIDKIEVSLIPVYLIVHKERIILKNIFFPL